MKLENKGIIIVSIGALFYFFMFYIRVLPSVMVDELSHALALNATETSFITASFVIPYALIQIPSGILVDRLGPKKIMCAGLIGVTIGSYLFQLAHSLTLPILSRMLIGVSFGAAFIAPMALVKQWLPKDMFATAAGFIQLLGCAGAMLSTPAAYLVQEIGWRDTFLYASLMALVLLGIFYVFIEEKDTSETKRDLDIKQDLLSIALNKQMWLVGAIAMASWSVMGGFAESLGIKYMSLLGGLSTPQASALMGVSWLSVAIISPLAGYVSEKTPNKYTPTLIIYSLALFAFILLISGLFSDPFALSCLLFIAALSSGGQPIAFGFISDIAPPHLLATAVSFCNACVIAGAFILQPLIGLIIDQFSTPDLAAYQLSFIPIISALCLGIICTFVLRKTKK